MINLFIYLLLLYNGVHGYRVSGRENPEKSDLIDSIGHFSQTGEFQGLEGVQKSFDFQLEHWTGRWMPDVEEQPTIAPDIGSGPSKLAHGVPMGPSNHCDDGKTHLEVDWNHSPVNYTCYGQNIIPNPLIQPTDYCVHIPEHYRAAHACMDETLEYNDAIPLYGTHRPVWPVYGEYVFVPKQRWIHSLEHGAVVMLYHPCANPLEIQRLKDLVKHCLRRYIITPYSLLSEDRPLALVTWGCRMEMSFVNPEIAQHFIREKALRGPEAISKDGLFNDGIISQSSIVTDKEDTTLCPHN